MSGDTIRPMGRTASFRTATDAAATAAQMLVTGEPLSRVWRFALTQMLDDYTSVLRHVGVAAASAMWRDAPPATGDARVNAAFSSGSPTVMRR